MPIFSLPSKYGIGCMSKEAYDFVDFLEESGQTYWQILPLGQTSYGDSPYQSFSTFASNPYFIDLEVFIEKGILSQRECEDCKFEGHPEYVDYDRIYSNRYKLLKKVFEATDLREDVGFANYEEKQASWLEDYSLFMAIKNSLDGISWQEWPQKLKTRDARALAEMKNKLTDDIKFYKFLQYTFSMQWEKLRAYANEHGIKIVGDIPIYVALDSADAWSNSDMFQFDEEKTPIAVAGCPPDGFSPTGQLWGNPLYNWRQHEKTGYAWWIERMEQCATLYDMVRVDHFRGFDEYYAIPAQDKTAEFGAWEKGPGIALFEALAPCMEGLEIIAEDLGFMTPTVLKLVADSGFPNMKVLQFGFDPYNDSVYLPHNFDKNCVVYTGTHDNETTVGWYRNQPDDVKTYVLAYLDMETDDLYSNKTEKLVTKKMIRLAMMSAANICIIPLQDYLCMDNRARVNAPASLGDNWKWRVRGEVFTQKLAGEIKNLVSMSARIQ